MGARLCVRTVVDVVVERAIETRAKGERFNRNGRRAEFVGVPEVDERMRESRD
jgi:hypothetical protein